MVSFEQGTAMEGGPVVHPASLRRIRAILTRKLCLRSVGFCEMTVARHRIGSGCEDCRV